MTVPLFDTPEDAALQGPSRHHGRVVDSRIQGDDAFVLLDTGPPGQPYLYGIYCSRHDGRWRGDGNGDGPGWFQAGPDSRLGTLVLWGLAPEGADRVRAEHETPMEESVEGIAYLIAWWRVPDPPDWPTVTAFRIRGEWVPA